MAVTKFNVDGQFLNRELGTLEFNRRVLAQAQDQQVPLLERLRFLCITTTNLDEFFEVRVAGLKELIEAGSSLSGVEQLSPQELLFEVNQKAARLIADQYECFNKQLVPAFQEQGIRFVRRDDLNEKQQEWVRDYAKYSVAPILSPLALDPSHPFPRILNKSLNFLVQLEGKDAFGRNCDLAVVQAPRSLPRIIKLPPEISDGHNDFLFLSSIMHKHMGFLFPGMKVKASYQFRVTRNSHLFVDPEEVDDLLTALAGELAGRRYGDAVRLEVADNCPEDLTQYLLDRFGLGQQDVYLVNGPVNINRLHAIYDLVDRPDLKYPPFLASIPSSLAPGVNKFHAIAQQDILLHHPYESFAPVVELLRDAAADPNVLAIKQTLYRTGADSAVVDALVAAAKTGKEVTVVVELRARFDEADNINLASRLQEAGAHLVYGVVGYKTHAKMCLIIRREERKLQKYAHLGTGNYHPRTARTYTDYGLLTCDARITGDVAKVFMQLTSLGKFKNLKELLQAPFTLHKTVLKKIKALAKLAGAGQQTRIVAKLNSLMEQEVIDSLYAASQAGVEIELIVRGPCGLRPGVPGLSDNIRVRSIIGRFLEHARVFCFESADETEVYLSSADWMERNFFKRVETCFPVINPSIKSRLVNDLEIQLQDNCQAWSLQPDGKYLRCTPNSDPPISAQDRLLSSHSKS